MELETPGAIERGGRADREVAFEPCRPGGLQPESMELLLAERSRESSGPVDLPDAPSSDVVSCELGAIDGPRAGLPHGGGYFGRMRELAGAWGRRDGASRSAYRSRIGTLLALAVTAVAVASSGLFGVIANVPPVSADRAQALVIISPCNPPDLSPSALDTPLPDVGVSLPTGSQLTVSYEVGVVHSTRDVAGRMRVHAEPQRRVPSDRGVAP